VHRGRGLLGSKTTSLSISKGSKESCLGLSYSLVIIQVCTGNLSRLNSIMFWCRGLLIIIDRGKGSMLSSLGSCKSSFELLLGCLHLIGVLNGEGGGQSQDRQKHLRRTRI
jgi:hypothetical protein